LIVGAAFRLSTLGHASRSTPREQLQRLSAAAVKDELFYLRETYPNEQAHLCRF
jgi:hypothetical protein